MDSSVPVWHVILSSPLSEDLRLEEWKYASLRGEARPRRANTFV